MKGVAKADAVRGAGAAMAAGALAVADVVAAVAADVVAPVDLLGVIVGN